MHLGKANPALVSQSALPVGSRRWWAGVAVSALLHGWLAWIYATHRGLPGEPAAVQEHRIEVGFVSLPAEQSAPTPDAVSATQHQVSKPAKPKPETRPQPRAEPRPKPAPPPKTKPQPEPKLAAFKDDFADLSHDFSKDEPNTTAPGASGGSRGMGLQPGAILNINPRIKYPLHAQQRSMQGTVVVLIHIGTDGSCTDVELIKSSGYQELDDEVLGSVQHWRFQPPTKGGMAVEGTYKHTVIFGADRALTDDFERHWRDMRIMPSP